MSKRGENIYKRKDGRWEARYIKSSSSTANNKTQYGYVYAKTYKEVRAKLQNARTESEEASVKEENTINVLLNNWLSQNKIKWKESSFVKYHNIVENHIRPILGLKKANEINENMLRSFVEIKSTSGRIDGAGGLSEKTLRDILTVVKAVIKLSGNTCLLNSLVLTLPKTTKKQMRVLSLKEQSILEQHLLAQPDQYKLGIILCLYTGIRIGELCALRWNDIELTEGNIRITKTMQRMQNLINEDKSKTKIIITPPKSSCSIRTIPLSNCILNKLIEARPVDTCAYFLTNDPDKFVEPRSYENIFKRYISDCGIENTNFHALRHTFATRCVEVGFEIKSLSEILGHANINITLDRYVHPTMILKRQNMEKLICPV